MKKLLAFMLSVALMVSLAVCGGGGDTTIDGSEGTASGGSSSMTKEEMLEAAEIAEEVEMNNALVENIVNAKQTYCGKILEVKAPVLTIEEDYIEVGQTVGALIVYLPEEDIIHLKPLQWITVVGRTKDDIQTETQVMGGTEWERQYFVMEQAYLVTDRYEYTGTPKSENDSYTGAWNVEFSDQMPKEVYDAAEDRFVMAQHYTKVVYFDESIDVSQYIGEEITFTAQCIDGKYYNAMIVQ